MFYILFLIQNIYTTINIIITITGKLILYSFLLWRLRGSAFSIYVYLDSSHRPPFKQFI